MSTTTLAFALCLLCAAISLALPLNSPLLQAYDYIVVGGGTAGLTVANRLSEDPSVNILVLEAGPADHGEDFITVPGMIGNGIGTIYDWNLSTTAQTSMDGKPRDIPQGHGLGGGSLINGMLWSRGEIDDWENIAELGNPGWTWSQMLPYFERSERYWELASEELSATYSIETNTSVHGSVGPVNVSFSDWFWPTSQFLFSALNELGVPTAFDSNDGQIAGASYLPLSLDPIDASRSTARRAYYDSIAARPNLWVATEQYVTQILFDGSSANPNALVSTSDKVPSGGEGSSPGVPGGMFGQTIVSASDYVARRTRRSVPVLQKWWDGVKGLARRQNMAVGATTIRANGVVFAADAGSPREIVTATREVIIAAGAFHSPQLLLLSGIGPAAALQTLKIPVNIDLPGVGSNLHDHGQVWAWYPYNDSAIVTPMDFITNSSFSANAWTDYQGNRTGPLTSTAYDGVAFPALAFISNGSTAITDAASTQTATQYLANNTDGSVGLGFAQQLRMLTQALSDPTRAAYEIINGNDGALTVANMRPLSRGSVVLASPQPFDPPPINPRYGSNPIDAQVLLAALRFNQQLIATDSLSQLDPTQMFPPPAASDDEILQYIAASMQTEYHPAGTCAMMPLALGGVVSPDLLVYGTENLRVVDSSTIPMLPAAHLQAVVLLTFYDSTLGRGYHTRSKQRKPSDVVSVYVVFAPAYHDRGLAIR
ncbi:hypothetical protein LTR62_005957 [Meristemomyces frigidus]|uniref:Glucose-methanol-choline oxidoreductase N-terminal domain-containing protein n=1 Tax=Meristemomyces frigidus TaxID=1508187 RepID=A0AAN7THY6_9PEZI|nr:hypothetical protein LTR62_005957 [Meristemomyces frigidus]